MKIAKLNGRNAVIAFALGLSGVVVACGGDDTGGGAGGGILDSSTDSRGGAAGQGGTAVVDGSAGRGGTAGADARLDGDGGISADSDLVIRIDTGADTSGDRSDGSGGSTGTDASDGGPRTDGDAATTTDAADGPVANDVTDGDGFVGPACPDGGDGVQHVQLYSFDLGVDGGASGLGDWSTFGNGPIVSSADDSAGESNPTSGSLHATITYPGYGSFPVLERYYPQALDLSCYRFMHSWIKITSSVASLERIQVYVLDRPNGSGGYGPFFAGGSPEITAIADGNWHELVTSLSSPPAVMASIHDIGIQIYPLAAPPANDSGTDAADATPPIPPPVEVFFDNIWFE